MCVDGSASLGERFCNVGFDLNAGKGECHRSQHALLVLMTPKAYFMPFSLGVLNKKLVNTQ